MDCGGSGSGSYELLHFLQYEELFNLDQHIQSIIFWSVTVEEECESLRWIYGQRKLDKTIENSEYSPDMCLRDFCAEKSNMSPTYEMEAVWLPIVWAVLKQLL